jgi:ankyrin repeat protein
MSAATKSTNHHEKISQLFSFSRQGKLEKVKNILLDYKDLPLNSIDRKGYTALHWASANGHLPVVKALVEAGATVDLQDEQGCTPLHLASRNGNADVVDFSLQNRADPNAHDALGFTPLHWSSIRGHLGVAKILIGSSANVDALDINDALAIHWAARRGHRDLVEFLIVDGGSKLDQKDGSGMTPENWASRKGFSEVVSLIQELDCKTREKIKSKRKSKKEKPKYRKLDVLEMKNLKTPPYTAFVGSYPSRTDQADLELFFDGLKITDINIPIDKLTGSGRGFAFVSFESSDDLLEALTMNDLQLRRRNVCVNLSERRSQNMTPVGTSMELPTQPKLATKPVIASDAKSVELIQAAKSGNVRLFEEYVGKGESIQVTDSLGNTPLHWASSRKNLLLVKMLLLNKAQINSKNYAQATPLHFAASSSNPEVLKFLLKNTPALNEKDENGQTPLHSASQTGCVDSVKLLLKNGANIESKDLHGLTPLHLAANKGHVNVVETLLAFKAEITPEEQKAFSKRYPQAASRQSNDINLLAKFLVGRKKVTKPILQEWREGKKASRIHDSLCNY